VTVTVNPISVPTSTGASWSAVFAIVTIGSGGSDGLSPGDSDGLADGDGEGEVLGEGVGDSDASTSGDSEGDADGVADASGLDGASSDGLVDGDSAGDGSRDADAGGSVGSTARAVGARPNCRRSEQTKSTPHDTASRRLPRALIERQSPRLAIAASSSPGQSIGAELLSAVGAEHAEPPG
jgi:hypothetical protein